MKYCEQKNIAPFDWRESLSRPAEEIEWHDAEELSEKASDWQMCYCGNADARIPRDENGAPLDAKLKAAGIKFSDEVAEMAQWIFEDEMEKADKHRIAALAIIHQIEKRASEIIAGLNE